MSNPARGFAFALAASLCYTLMTVGVYLGAESVPAAQLLFFRGAVACVVLFPLAKASWPAMNQSELWKVLVIALGAGLAIGASFLNLQLTSVGTARSFGNLGLVSTLAIAYFFLGERISKRSIVGLCIIVSAFFVLLSDSVVRPEPISIGLGIFEAVMVGVVATTLRAVAGKVSSAFVVWAVAVAMITTSFLFGGKWAPLTQATTVLISVVAIAGAVGQLLSVVAYRHIQAGVAATLERTDLVWAVVLVALIEFKMPHPLEITAYLLVILGVVILQPGLLFKRRGKKTRDEEADRESARN